MGLVIARNSNNIVFNHDYKEIELKYDNSLEALWVYMLGDPKPSFTPSLLHELKDLYKVIKAYSSNCNPVKYLIAASSVPNIFNLGGDLMHFQNCVRLQDKVSLTEYAYSCLDMGFENTRNLERDITTISLLQGAALGGGFEAALSCSTIIAEKGVKIAFPEILFNLFPGMGAYTYLSRKVEPCFVEEMITSGRTYSSDELFERGVIDILAEPGDGVSVLNEYVTKHRRRRTGYVAMQKARLRTYPVSLKELRDITDIWVEAALILKEKDLKVMDRLIHKQLMLAGKPEIYQVA